MILPYVYKLTHRETGEFYIGYRSANKIPSDQDLPIYQSSSKTVAEIGFDNFNWEIIAEFFHGDYAYDFEQELISEHIDDPLCINKHCVIGGRNRFKVQFGHSVSEETRQKLREANLGRVTSEDTRKKQSDALKGRALSEDHIKAIRKPKSEETRQRMKKPKSDAQKENMRKAFQSEEYRAKLRAAQQARRERERLERETK